MHINPQFYSIYTLSILVVLTATISVFLYRASTEENSSLASLLSAFLFVWFLSAFFVAKSGFFIHATIPASVVSAVMLVLGISIFLLNQSVKKLILSVPVHFLILLQTFRILGAVFIFAYLDGKLPGYWALTTGSGDIITSILAPFVAYAAYKKVKQWKAITFAWCLFGIFDFIHAVIISALSNPTPFRMFYPEPSLNLINFFPFAIIPLFTLPLMILIHIFILTKLKQPAT